MTGSDKFSLNRQCSLFETNYSVSF